MPVSLSSLPRGYQTAALPTYPNKTQLSAKMTLVFTVVHRINRTKLKEHRLICMPTSFSKETEGRSQLYYTQAGIYVDTPQHNAIGIVTFSITGHTLYRGLTRGGPGGQPGSPLGFGAALQQVGQAASAVGGAVRELFGGAAQQGPAPAAASPLVDGAAAIKDFEDTIRYYFFPDEAGQGETETNPGDLELEFLHLGAPSSAEDRTGLMGYLIHPHRNLVTLRQDAAKPFLWYYAFQFAGIKPLSQDPPPDSFLSTFTSPKSLIARVLERLNNVVTSVNNLRTAFDTLVQTVTGPISTFVIGVSNLAQAVQGFVTGVEATIRFPLYASQTLLGSIKSVLNLPAHSVQTLRLTAEALSHLLTPATLGQSFSGAFGGTSLTAGVNDRLTLTINGGTTRTLALGTQTSGPAIAAAIQAQIRELVPTYQSNIPAYRDFTAVYEPAGGRYVLTSGTVGSDSASVVVTPSPDLALTPNDAAALLKLSPHHGGVEHQGSAAPLVALSLLRDVMLACTRLEAFPDYFADTLPDQVTTLGRLQTAPVPGGTVGKEVRMTSVLLTPGDSLQSVAARSGVAWETVALANHLQFPYVLTAPTTVAQGQASGGDITALSDAGQTWEVNQWQGQRLDLIGRDGAGQSRMIVGNTATTLTVDTPWVTLPTPTTHYAIRQASNPILDTRAMTEATPDTLTDTTLALLPESRRGMQLRILTGTGAGQQRRITLHTTDTYVVSPPWDVVPDAGRLYAVLIPQAPVRRNVLLVGDPVAIPRQARVARPRTVRAPLQDMATITGRALTQESLLFGTDLLFRAGAVALDPVRQDLALVRGLPNVRQATLNLLNLVLGELEYAPGLGSFLHESLGTMATTPSQLELLHSVERTIKQDGRIARLGASHLSTVGGAVALSFEAVAITGETLDRIAIR